MLKRTFSLLSAAFIASSGAVLLASNISNNQLSYQLQSSLSTQSVIPVFDFNEKITDKYKYTSESQISSELVKINNLPIEILSNKISSIETASKGKNYYYYYFLYHILGLDQDTFNKINSCINEGITAVSAILSFACPELAPIAAIVAAILIFQWKVWNIPSYDTGKGVEIQFFGATPWIITAVSSQ